ncbi:MAG TPA: hypothetical protein VFG59_12900 [Anaeromyxobacter sp.]|nr:hypothetical protein [Anaeromyxobacter sp.]
MPGKAKAAEGLDGQELKRELSEVERRLDALEKDLNRAELARESALRERQEAVAELTEIREELAAARTESEEAAAARQQREADLDRAAVALRDAEPALATGSTAELSALLPQVAQAFGEVHERQGMAAVDAAQDALARSDLAAARVAVLAALRAARRPAG